MFHASDSVTYDIAPGNTMRPHTGFELQKLWLDRWLRGEDNGIDALPPVQIFVQGPDQWRYEHDWPLPDEQRIRLYLASEPSKTVISRNDGTLSAGLPADAAEASYDFDPAISRHPVAVSMPTIVMVADGEPTLKETILPAGARREHGRLIMDKAGYEAQAVTWTSLELPQPTEVTGYPRLVLWASVSRPEADFIAELTDVAPLDDGTWSSTQITRGYLRASAQFSRTGPTELDPGAVCKYEIELQPTSYVVPAGHRVRFTVQGAAIDPDLDLSWHGPGLGEQPFTVTIRTGPEYASYAEVPVIGAVPFFG
jgi:putative CocE/NonD family hydrolase